MAQRKRKPNDRKRTLKHLTVAIHAADLKSLREIVQTYPLDFGCRPQAIPDATGAYYTTALVSLAERDLLRNRGLDIRDLFDQTSGDRTAKATIGRGDRFNGGKILPQGVGSRPNAPDNDLGSIMNPDEINSAIQGLVNEYGIPTFDVPNATTEGSGGKGGMTGPVNPNAYHVYFTAGVHARERGGPDNLIYFIADLLFGQKHSTGLTYGRFRRNRNRTPPALTLGVDIRLDFLWRFHRDFHPAAQQRLASHRDDTMARYAFEPETRVLLAEAALERQRYTRRSGAGGQTKTPAD